MKTEHIETSHIHHFLVLKRIFASWPVVCVLLLSLTLPAPSQRAESGGKPSLDVMTVNLYVGGDIGRVMLLNPADTNYVEELIGTVTGVYYEIVASAPPVRIQMVANEIAE